MAIYDPNLEFDSWNDDTQNIDEHPSRKKLFLGIGSASLLVAAGAAFAFFFAAPKSPVMTAPLANIVSEDGAVKANVIQNLTPTEAEEAISSPDIKVETTDSGSEVLVNPDTGTVYVPDVVDINVPEMVSTKCLPSVVSINVHADGTTSNGSGVIIDNAGHVLTNDHVVLGSNNISITANGQSYSAWIVGSDATSDLVVLQMDLGDNQVTPIEIGDSSTLKIGQWVMAIGSPFGLDQSVSVGIVSSLARSTVLPSWSGTNIYTDLIQTDAATNPGSSGGALVNQQGQLVGINSIISSYDGSFSGVGFAIPVNYAMKVANAIIAGNPVEHAVLGVDLTTVTPEVAQNASLGATAGAYITNVVPGSPAEACGLRIGDIILGIDDTMVDSSESLIAGVRACDPGKDVTLSVCRGAEIVTVQTKLGSDGGNLICQA